LEDAKTTVRIASTNDREIIYRIRHDVYAKEIGQYPENAKRLLTDDLDTRNTFLVAYSANELAGFVSITPPGGSYSIDKYVSRADWPITYSSSLNEIRLLTVTRKHRSRAIAALLMYAALRYVEEHGGSRIVAMGRRDLLPLYEGVGMSRAGLTIQSGAVTYELMEASVSALRERLRSQPRLLDRLQRSCRWHLDMPFLTDVPCFHGGAFFQAIGERFETLALSKEIINADVLDAWFPPSPRVISALETHLPWLLQTSPPSDARGLIQVISEVREIPAESLMAGPGSSALMYLSFQRWHTPGSRVLLPEPTYGEYAHIFGQVIGCNIDRLTLEENDQFCIRQEAILNELSRNKYDLLVLVNPNNPTGKLLRTHEMADLLAQIGPSTRVWLDEAYLDYSGAGQSMEAYAANSQNIFVCKSMSKVYALSGARSAYLCGPPDEILGLRRYQPPWAVSLPAQVAACEALRDPDYYTQRYKETVVLRKSLAAMLAAALPGAEITESVANWILYKLNEDHFDAAKVCERCRLDKVYLRDAGVSSHLLSPRTIRVAVKDKAANERIIESLTTAVRELQRGNC
jgi:histidinol-phosphate/aromatic aminotransferase/cobyric acid decarboxylase-like protein/GNAT superfamily N-acetyltransferase